MTYRSLIFRSHYEGLHEDGEFTYMHINDILENPDYHRFIDEADEIVFAISDSQLDVIAEETKKFIAKLGNVKIVAGRARGSI